MKRTTQGHLSELTEERCLSAGGLGGLAALEGSEDGHCRVILASLSCQAMITRHRDEKSISPAHREKKGCPKPAHLVFATGRTPKRAAVADGH